MIDTTGSLIAGYAVAGGLFLFYALTLWLRARALRRRRGFHAE